MENLFQGSKLLAAVEAGEFFIENDKAVSRYSLSKKIFKLGFEASVAKIAYDILDHVYFKSRPKNSREVIERIQKISERIIRSAKNDQNDPEEIIDALHKEGVKYEEIKIAMRKVGFHVISKDGGGGLIIIGRPKWLTKGEPVWSRDCPILT